ncbi:C40 family peptidase [Paenibacillus physcomitrellae]|uniref:Hydrolase n=1 Tax=Paenibacillus physcomitrellae TaxID=1619311 RepID=A0ABQ1G592_9BACL|nr:C40 family peptidase [Paenibacillus physcomitrellae]GGA37015.1 hydrolase [Paenibacillus physcomitrellae]
MSRVFSTLTILLVVICMIFTSGLAYASSELSDVQHKLKEVQQEKIASQQNLSDSKSEMNEIQKEVQASNEKLNHLDQYIGSVTDQMQLLVADIQREETNLTQIAQDLQEADSRIEQRNKRLAEKLRSLYMDGNVSYLDVLLNSTSFSDFIDRFQSLEEISRSDKDMLESNKQDKQLIAEKEVQLQQELAQVQQNYKTMQQKQTDLVSQKNKEAVNNVSYSQKQKHLENTAQSEMQNLQVLAEQEAALLQQEKELKALAESSSELATHASLQKVIHPLLGIKYVWGGTTTDGFDCSGFTRYVLAKYGVHLPRTSAEQSHFGDYISKDDLRTGDLVFFNTYGQPGTVTHVAIYIGNGQIANAVSTSVQINRLNDSYFGPRYLTARRVLSDKQYQAITK